MDNTEDDTTLLAAYLSVDSDLVSDGDTTISGTSQITLMVIDPPPPPSNFLGHIDLTVSDDNDIIIPPSHFLGHIDLTSDNTGFSMDIDSELWGTEPIDLSLDKDDKDTNMQDPSTFTTTYIDLTEE